MTRCTLSGWDAQQSVAAHYRSLRSNPPGQPSEIFQLKPKSRKQTCPVHLFVPFKTPVSQPVCYGLIFYHLFDSLYEHTDHI